jgi:glycolate oxidase iron-sulfur subunit
VSSGGEGGEAVVSAGLHASERPDAPGAGLAGVLADQGERLSHCVHCGFCLPACPTYLRLGDEADSPRGRLHLMGAVAEGRLNPGSDAFQTHIERCLGCRACETVCPSGVEYGLILERAREVAATARRPSLAQRLLLGAVERPWAFRIWMGGSRLLRATGLPALLTRLVPAVGPLARLRLGVAMLAASAPARIPAEVRNTGAGTVTRDGRFPGREGDPGTETDPRGPAPARGTAGRVALLTGCVQAHLFRRVNEATRRVLEVNGWEVVPAPDQGCCGALHAHGGRLETARAMARNNLRAFRAAAPDRIGVNAAGCGAAMREYVHLLEEGRAEERELARWLSERVRDVSELLAGEGAEPRRGAPLPLKVAYDPPCHLLHAQRVVDPPVRMFRAIPGLELVALENGEECCGGAGIYGITHPELGGRIGADKVDAVRRSGARVVATGNPGCMMQIGAGLRMAGLEVQVVHPVELLDESYRRAGYVASNGGQE